MSAEMTFAESLVSPDAAVAQALANARRPIDSLQVQVDRLAAREVTPHNWSGLQMVAAEAAHLGSAIAKLQMAQVATALALARLREGGQTQRILVERRDIRQLSGGGGASV